MLGDETKIKEIARKVCEQRGFKLYDIQFVTGSRGRGRMLRIFIEHLEVSNGLSLILDVEDAVPGASSYMLEVSSPGLERPLIEKGHYETAIGKQISVYCISSPMSSNEHSKRLQFNGKLVRLDQDNIYVEIDEKEFVVPFNIIKKAKTIFKIEKQEKKSNKRKK